MKLFAPAVGWNDYDYVDAGGCQPSTAPQVL